ncbi:MAG: hypothetical protein U9R68_00135 [Planctomycetota bacterium]|nr:hypothetical protein [Planctomycetota bacterium]
MLRFRKSCSLAIVFILVAGFGPRALGMAKDTRVFRAGAFAIDVAPTKLPVIVNGGMTERTADKVVDPLHARCLVLDDGRTQLAIAVVDSCLIPRTLLDKAKSMAGDRTGIPVERMLISATHCHSAPSVCPALGSGEETEYGQYLAARIAEGIAEAHKRLQPARVGWAVDKDPRNVFCRRYLMKPGTARTSPFTGHTGDRCQMNPGYQNPSAVKRAGPVDDDVSVLSLQTRDGRPLALLANYSTHYAGAPALSADYFAVFARKIAEKIGAPEGFVAMMSNGTSGDANCCDFDKPRRRFDRFTVGEDTAGAAYRAYQRIAYHDWVPLAMEERRLTLKVRMPTGEEVAEAEAFIEAKCKGRKPKSIPEVYAWETVHLSRMPPTRELRLQALRIGELGITAIPCEVYGSTGLRLKAKSPLKPTFNISLANGCEGYIPPPDQHELGGYTTWRARSACLEPQAEPRIVACLLEMLGQVAPPSR